jgi:lipoprotein-releasing system permease protein
MYKLFLSFRYFRCRPINIIPVMCMMLGVMALIVILAVMDGFQAQLRATLRGTLSDLIIQVNYESDFEKWEELLLNTEGVEAVSPHLLSFCLVAEIGKDAGASGRARPAQMDGAMVRGIDAEREAAVSSFRDYLIYRERGALAREEADWRSSTPDPDRPFAVMNPRWDDRAGVILGVHLARKLRVWPPRLKPGSEADPVYLYDRVYLTTMVQSEDGKGYRAEERDFCVTGIYESGNQDIDAHIAFMKRSEAREFFMLKQDPEEIRVQLTDYETMHAKVRKNLLDRRHDIYAQTATRQEAWPEHLLPFGVMSWEDVRRNFLNAIDNEKGLIAIIAGMAFVVTGFMIFSILSMIVTMKTRDIGILKAIGGTTQGVLQIFIVNGLLVGVIGSSLGLVLGLVFVNHINTVKDFLNRTFGWEPFPQNIYLFSEIPTRLMPGEVAIVTVMALIVALVGAILPALRAARMDPVESLRYE